MPFVWLEADHEPGPASIRSYLERNSIGLLSAATTIDPPSVEWFGSFELKPFMFFDQNPGLDISDAE